MPATPRVASMNVGSVREVSWRNDVVTTAIWKSPVAGRVPLRGVNFRGDQQADRTVHGGPDKAVYAYANEDYAFWKAAENVDVVPGLFGENLTTEGLDLALSVIGERWRVGSAVLEVAQPRLPCFKLGIRMDDEHFPRRFLAAARLGAYFRVVREGDVGAGDEIVVISRPAHGVTLRTMAAALTDPSQGARLASVPYIPAFWRRFARS